MIKKTVLLTALLLFAAALLSGAATAQSARDYISIVGSSTVYPFATVVAEQFGKTTKFKTPKIESTGSGGGFKLFCAGVGTENPDITNASRAMKKSEFDTCQSNGVKDIVEVKIGYDGIVVANSKKAPALKLTRKDLFLALAKDVPDPKGGEEAVANPYKTWQDVNPALPNVKIESAGAAPHLRYAGCLRRTGYGARGRRIRLDQSLGQERQEKISGHFADGPRRRRLR